MMKDSFKYLLKLFPFFLSKEEGSNFYKSQSVTHELVQGVYQSLFEVSESFRLNKRLYVWREQSEDYVYKIHFVANYPRIKSVTLYKNDSVIYSDEYSYDEDVSQFEYSYDGNTLNDTDNDYMVVIPEDTFKIIVETYDEFTIMKGYPENDIIKGDEYDHDESLDEIGALNNIPRKEYILVEKELYPVTEPPYNNRLTEDDYHYMKRQLEYNLRLHDTPLPVLELWKLFGINAKMENRERLLLKVFDLEKHPNFKDTNAAGDGWFSGTLDDDGNIIPWTPKPWEHQDKFCNYIKKTNLFFFVKPSTNIPPVGQPVYLNFLILDSMGHDLTQDGYTFTIILDDEIIAENITDDHYKLDSSYFSQISITVVTVECYSSTGELVKSVDLEFQLRGCNTADWYVSPNGSDTNNTGKSINSPFKTIQKAVNSVMAEKNLINITEGEYTIDSPIVLNESCTIMCCDNVTVENTEDNVFFKVPVGCSLNLKDITLKHLISSDVTCLFTNQNSNNVLDVVIYPISRKGYFSINSDGDLILTVEDGLNNNFHISNGDLITTMSGYSINSNGDLILTI